MPLGAVLEPRLEMKKARMREHPGRLIVSFARRDAGRLAHTIDDTALLQRDFLYLPRRAIALVDDRVRLAVKFVDKAAVLAVIL